MKIRTGFVSNSSSSSFVLAIRNDCTIENIKNEILKDKESLITFVKDNLEYVDLEEDDNLKTLEGDMLYDAIATRIAKDIFNNFNYTCMKLENWKISAAEWGTEGDDDLLGLYFYGVGRENIDTEKIKIVDIGH